MISKAIITSAGLGSRMKYITSVMPKALLPLFKEENGKKVMRPIIDLIMNSLISCGVNNFGIVVGRHGKLLMDYLFERGVTFFFQDTPKGFGDAVLRAENFACGEPFFVHADDGVLTGGYEEAKSLFEENNPEAVLLLRKVNNPYRYGIAKVKDKGTAYNHKIYYVLDVQEKPSNPFSNLAISAVYIFQPKIFTYLKQVDVKDGELELTYGIKKIIENGGEVIALELENEKWLNVGDPENYFKALEYSYKYL
ncbi:nucleotidyltransferase [Acidianus sulfidivorans JP7]|uniref:UTP--glucose-1-phosphate uridylyltransferase n=1 Tax=Acidianus sulfidivorans JP7 TaxID=619593 RepID=A0A2U9IN72_9CREN|nr:sugar phosphate nucleotidyltransferase [Acidianus sulfidivorans]AWR97519.1 nucleotidyltransferase [Acidianus sulfidivorans JP7]